MLRAKGRNIVGQQLPTLLDDTCCVCLHSLLHLVACCWELLRKVWNRSNFKLCANGLNSLANNAATVCTRLKNEISFRSSKNNTPCRERTKCKKLRCPVLPILASRSPISLLLVRQFRFIKPPLCRYGWDRGPHYIEFSVQNNFVCQASYWQKLIRQWPNNTVNLIIGHVHNIDSNEIQEKTKGKRTAISALTLWIGSAFNDRLAGKIVFANRPYTMDRLR